MSKPFKRNIFTHTNKYQIRIILPLMVTIFLILILTSVLYYFSFHTDSAVYESEKSTMIFYNYQIELFKQIMPFILALFSLLVIILIYWTYHLTNKVLGPFDRIINELDKMIHGDKEWTLLTTRDGDDMFEQLLQRINYIVNKIK
ncbi:MAG: hypothetical protein HQK76_08300 [Desulfobacterales bacterium]|nr:hypothetical protein [Desulfobacterales bacterium]